MEDIPQDNGLPTGRSIEKGSLTWKPLRFFTFYRLLLACLLVFLFSAVDDPEPLGSSDPELFRLTGLAYVIYSGATLAAAFLHWPSYRIQVFVQIIIDIIAITLLMRASGGVDSGLGILLVVAVAAGGLLLPGRVAFLFAALASLAVLLEQGLGFLAGSSSGTSAQAGMLGIAFFATASLAHLLAQRIRETEALAQRRGIDLANLTQLNAHIIQHLQAGIVVIDSNGYIRLINETAWRLLGMPAAAEQQALEAVSPELARSLGDWKARPQEEAGVFRPATGQTDVMPHFRSLGTARGTGTLAFLEDAARLAEQAQQMKLAALGRLTASIAHEIRNPLGAISHAGQLLEESPDLPAEDRRMIEIICNHSRRVNTIIEDILHLSRRERSHPQDLQLADWLAQFTDEFMASAGLSADQLGMAIEPPELTVLFDRGHLHQVLWNLCQNGLHHGAQEGKPAHLQLRGGYTQDDQGAFLEVLDSGPGVKPDIAQHLFEPFFTTQSQGTGLGLYIARELCESNQARLSYHPLPVGGSCFRIDFAISRQEPEST